MVEAAKRFGQSLLAISESRLELLLLEAQEEQERLVRAMLLTLAAAASGLLASAALSGALIILLWEYSPLGAVMAISAIYAAASLWFRWRLMRLLREWRHFPATLDQLRKDQVCLERHLT